MTEATFRSRLMELTQKSRQATRLYGGVGRGSGGTQSELAEMQAFQWKGVNSELHHELSFILETRTGKGLISSIFGLRDRLVSDVRNFETDLHTKQQALVLASESGDFGKAMLLGRDLVILKARLQATSAAHHELQDVIEKSRVLPVSLPVGKQEVAPQEIIRSKANENLAQVIPLRRRS